MSGKTVGVVFSNVVVVISQTDVAVSPLRVPALRSACKIINYQCNHDSSILTWCCTISTASSISAEFKHFLCEWVSDNILFILVNDFKNIYIVHKKMQYLTQF